MRTEDGHIIFQCLNGNPAAFGLLVDKYKASIYALAYSKLRHFEDAEDVTQEVFIKAYRKLHTLRVWDNFLAWLYAITSNHCKQWIRSQSKRPDCEFIADHSEYQDHHSMDSYINESVYRSIHEALDALPETFRQVLMLHYFGGLKSTEIAKLLGTSTSTITKRLATGRAKLKEEMLTMMSEAYEQNKLGMNFTFRIMAILRNTKIQHLPRTRWLPFGVSILSGIIITLLSFSFPQISLHAVIPGSMLAEEGSIELSSSFPGIDGNIYDQINAMPYVSVPVELMTKHRIYSRTGLTDNSNPAIGDHGDNHSSQIGQGTATSAGQKNNMPVTEMMTISGQVLKGDSPVSDAHVYIYDFVDGIIQQGETETDGYFHIKIPKPENGRLEQLPLTVVAKHPQYSYGWTFVTKDNSDDLIIWLKQPKSISGKITDESGTPVKLAKALIRMMFYPGDKTMMIGDYIPGCTTTTDSNGDFILNGLPDGSKAYLMIAAPGYARQDVVNSDINAGTDGLLLKLKKGGRVEGWAILHETGKLMQGARIYAQTSGSRAESITDENGNYVLDNLPEGSYTITASQYSQDFEYFKKKQIDWIGIPKNYVRVMAGETVKGVNIELTEGVIVSGKVTDRDTNEPIPNQRVGLSLETQRTGYEAYTDQNGIYSIRAIPGKAQIYVQAKDGYLVTPSKPEYLDFDTRNIIIPEGKGLANVDFQLRKGFTFTGTVLSPEGKPVDGAEIKDRMHSSKICGRSDENGKFTASGIVEGKPGEKLMIEARQETLQLRSYLELEPKPGLDVNIIMEKYDLTAISGGVVDKQGNPIPSAKISIQRFKDVMRDRGPSTTFGYTANNAGIYNIYGIIVGDEYGVIAEASGYPKFQTEKFIAKADMRMKDIILISEGRFLEGTIKDTNGNPVADADVNLYRQMDIYRSDVNGHFRIDGLKDAVVYYVSINHPSYGKSLFYFMPTNQAQDYILEKPNGFLGGKVIDADGNPVMDASVSISSDGPVWTYHRSGHVDGAVITDSQGKFRMSNLIANKIENIWVFKSGYGKSFENVEMNRDDAVFVLKQEPEPKRELTQQEKQMRDYAKATGGHFKELVGKPAPDLDVAEWINGQPIKLADLKGRLVVLNFWKSWGIMQMEPLRLFNTLQNEYGNKGLVCITVHEFTSQPNELKEFVAKSGVSYSIAIDKKPSIAIADGVTFDRYGIFQGPAVIIINRDATIRGRVEVFELEKMIQELLSE